MNMMMYIYLYILSHYNVLHLEIRFTLEIRFLIKIFVKEFPDSIITFFLYIISMKDDNC